MKKIILTIITIFVYSIYLKAQVSAIPFSQSMDTYQQITGTIVDTPFADDTYFNSLPIGFNFNYNGFVTNQFGISCNGYIMLGTTGTSGYSPTDGTRSIYGFQGDLMNNNGGGNIQYVTLGVAPNRVLIVQWKDYAIYSGAFAHLNFQIRLLEGSNCIQMWYGTNSRTFAGGFVTFYAGLTGSTSGDYNLRNTTNDWTNTSAAASFPGTGCHFTMSSVLPSGLVYSFGTCPATGTSYSYLSGKVFLDMNNNGVQDTLENGLPNVLIHENTQNINITTDVNGNYALFYMDSTLTYNVSCTPLVYSTQSSIPNTYSINPSTQSTAQLDFGLHYVANIDDVGITSNAFPFPYPNALVHFHTTYHNMGTVMESDTIKFVKDSRYTFVNSIPPPVFISGDSMYWIYSNLNLFEYRTINMNLQADTTIVVGDTLVSKWIIQPYASDTAQNNNIYLMHQQAFASWDPNAKTVVPEGNISNTQQLEYTINFQNTGTAPASNVFMHDNLNSNLDISTLNIIGYSHPMTYSITGPGDVLFSFANINLPDSTTNETASHGYVRFTISPNNNLLPGTVINNTGAIYFDANSPVITNTTVNTIGNATTVGVATISEKDNSIIISPNPFTSQTTISFSELQRNTIIKITDVLGNIVKSEQLPVNSKSATIDMSGFSKGIYFVQIRDGGSTGSPTNVVNRKIVVE